MISITIMIMIVIVVFTSIRRSIITVIFILIILREAGVH